MATHAEAIAETLAGGGVEFLFGLPGGEVSIDKMVERPASPENREGSSDNESWSVVEDRIDGW